MRQLSTVTLVASALLPVFLTGCATSEPQMTPTGKAGHFINCSGEQSWNACFERAAELCPAGYQRHSQDSARNEAWTMRGDEVRLEGGVQRTMLISCT